MDGWMDGCVGFRDWGSFVLFLFVLSFGGVAECVEVVTL